MTVLLAAAIVAGYLAAANAKNLWPFGGENLESRIENQVEDPTAGWQTYRNEQYGFEVKHPKEWVVGSCGSQDLPPGSPYAIYFNMDPQFCNQTRVDMPASIVILVYKKDGYASVLNNLRNPWLKLTEQDLVVAGNISAKKFTGEDGFDAIVFQHLNYTFDIAEQDIEPTFFDQFISTFKFIEPVPAGWQTYHNEKYGFEFSYPADHTAYVVADQKNEKLIPAISTSDRVAVAEREEFVFCCEPNVLSFEVVKDDALPSEWIGQNVNKFTAEQDIKSTRDVIFLGKQAVEVIAEGRIDSVYKLLVTKLDGHLLVIKQRYNSPFLNQILSTFKFIE
ncbi:MAG: hypothetical protein Q8P75_00195 [bacterium]|nr:hypothetical protein [bacterium]